MLINKQSPYEGLFRTLTFEQWVSICVTLVGCVFNICMFLIARPTKDYSGLFISLVATTTLAVIADRVARFNSENKHTKQLSSFNPVKHDLHFLGDSVAGMNWFLENYSGALAVRNTVFRSADGELAYIYGDIARFNAAARSLIGPRCSWYDMILEDPQEEIKGFHLDLPEAMRRFHYVSELKIRVPLIQLLIIDYRETSAVLLGWGYKADKDNRVFVSTDKDVTRYFKDYFELLRTEYSEPKFRSVSNRAASPPAATP